MAYGIDSGVSNNAQAGGVISSGADQANTDVANQAETNQIGQNATRISQLLKWANDLIMGILKNIGG